MSHTKNAANEQQVKEETRKQVSKRIDELNDIKTVMATPQGRRFMWRLVNEICHYDTNDAQHSGSMTYLSLGERNVGRIVKADLYAASHDLYQLMERENWALLKGDK